jgi:hypothetical protein
MSKFKATFTHSSSQQITLIFPSLNWATAGDAAWTTFDLNQPSRDGWQLIALDLVA